MRHATGEGTGVVNEFEFEFDGGRRSGGRSGWPERGRGAAVWVPALALALCALAVGSPVSAQERADTALPMGVELKLVYETQYRPRLAVQPFTGPGAGAATEQVHRIVQRDLDYSDRFDMLTRIPESMRAGAADYRAWNDLGVVYLVTGGIEEAPAGYRLRLALHDVVYGTVKEIQVFRLPPTDDPDFRLAVHAAADEVVRWATGEPGIAATRIALTLLRNDGTHELMTVDSDGENLRRLHKEQSIYSPAWSPDGTRIAYAQTDYASDQRIVERDLRTGQVRVLSERDLGAQTPTYSPDGKKVAMGLWIDNGMEIHDYDVERYCCLRRLSRRPRIDMHPSYSPDGRRIVFQSDRLGNPHIFIMPANGGDAELLTPFERGGGAFYFGPSWSPKGPRIVFTGRSRGVNQVMYADVNRPGAPVQQVTSQGRSEDPSWAPDGRHIVFSGVRDDGMGLYVIDLVTGRIRPLVTGGRYRMPDWSPVQMRAAALTDGP